jgi:hypothetical protein
MDVLGKGHLSGGVATVTNTITLPAPLCALGGAGLLHDVTLAVALYHSNRVYKSKRESARPGEENPLHQTNPRRDRAKRYEDPEPEECTEAAETTTGRQTDGQARNAAKAAPGET